MGATVLLVDDQPVIRLGLRASLEREEDLAVVGEAGDTEAALDLVGELGPDLVVLESRMSGEASGVRLCKDLKAMLEPPRVLFYAAHNSHPEVYSCYLAGADGFVHKGEEPRRLADAVREVAKGKRVWLLGRGPEEVSPEPIAADDLLTAREQEVLALVLEGHSNPEVARMMCVSLATVKTHLSNVFKKLGISGREELFPGWGGPAFGRRR
jgi:DNA-binding NarL/FixJ family response regulator